MFHSHSCLWSCTVQGLRTFLVHQNIQRLRVHHRGSLVRHSRQNMVFYLTDILERKSGDENMPINVTNRETKNKQTYRQTDKQTNIHTDKQTDRQTNRETNRPTDKHTYRQTNRQTDRETDRQTNKQTDTHRQ